MIVERLNLPAPRALPLRAALRRAWTWWWWSVRSMWPTATSCPAGAATGLTQAFVIELTDTAPMWFGFGVSGRYPMAVAS